MSGKLSYHFFMKTLGSKVIPVFLFLLGVTLVATVPVTKPKETSRGVKLAISPEHLSHFVLGYKLVAADMLWIRLLQEIDYRDGDVVNKGWVFHMLDGITTLDPRYRIPFSVGGTILSVLVQDVEGARLLYERAVENFPNHWPMIYRAAYHSLYEVGDCKRAAELLNMAGYAGAPPWLSLIHI